MSVQKLYIQQKVFSFAEQFTVKNELDEDIYFIEGSLFKIPKTFHIRDAGQKEVAQIVKKTWSFMPTFFVEVDGDLILTIKKEWTFFKAKYSLDIDGWEMHGDWWDMDFQLYRHGEVVGSVQKKWFTWGDTYELTLADDPYLEKVMIALVVAIDYAKSEESTAATMS